MRRKIVLASLVLIGIVLIVGGSVIASAQSAQGEKYGGTLRIVEDNPIDSLNPITTNWLPDAGDFIYGSLVSRDRDFKYRDYIIKSWTISEDGLAWTLHFKKGVKFHDGEPFTAQVFVDWVPVLQNGVTSYDWENVKDATVVDDYTAVVEMKAPYPDFLHTLFSTYSTPIAPEYWKKVGEKEGYGYDKVCGLGPYKLVARPSKEKIVLERNEDFTWGPSWWDNQGPAYIERIEYSYVKEDATRLAKLEAKEADIIWSGVPDFKVSQYEADPSITLIKAGSQIVHYFGMDLACPYLKDVRVRRAINLALNRKAIGKVVYGNTGEPAHQFLRPFVPSADIPEDLKSYYNLDKAKELMKEAGHPNGFTLRTMTTDDAVIKKLATVVQAQLKEALGIKLVISSYDMETFMAKRRAHEGYDSSVMYYGYDSPGIFHWFFHSSMIPSPDYLSVNNPFVDLIDEAARTAPTPEIFNAYYRLLNMAMQKIVIPYAPIYFPSNLEAYLTKRVAGWKTLTLGGAPITDLWIPKAARK